MYTGKAMTGLTTRGNLQPISRAALISLRNTGLVFHHHPLLSSSKLQFTNHTGRPMVLLSTGIGGVLVHQQSRHRDCQF